MKQAILIAVVALGVLPFLPGAPAVLTTRVNAAQPESPAAPADRALVAATQELLSALGLAPGPADGLMGNRTRGAIVAFQKAEGLPPTGVPSNALIQRMTAALSRARTELPLESRTAPPAAGNEPVPTEMPKAPRIDTRIEAIAPAAGPPPVLIGARWRIEDASGARFNVVFREDGTLEGTGADRFWKWRRTGNEVRIVYDNGWGARITRIGHLAEGGIQGIAAGRDGTTWQWTGQQLDDTADAAGRWPVNGRKPGEFRR